MKTCNPFFACTPFIATACLLAGSPALCAPAAAQLEKCTAAATRLSCTAAENEAALAAVPATPREYMLHGLMLLNRDRFAEAITDFSRAHMDDPKDASYLGFRALAYVRAGDRMAATRDIDAALAIDPRNLQAFLARGVMAQDQAAYSDAIAAFTKALEIQPDERMAIVNRALVNKLAGNEEATLRDAAAAIGLSAAVGKMHFIRAEMFLRQHRPDLLMAEAEAATTTDPDPAMGYASAAQIYLMAELRAEAVRALDRSLEIRPTEFAYALRARARPREERAARQQDIDAALKLVPNSATALQEQARLQQELGDAKAAAVSLSQGMATSFQPGQLLFQRAQAWQRADELDKALGDTAAAITADRGMIEAYLLRANLFRQQHKPDAALKVAKEIVAANPENALAYVVAAKIYAKFARDKDATRAFDRAIAIRPEAYMYLNRSQTRPVADIAGRAADIDAAYRLDPALPEAVTAKVRLQIQLGDLAGAIAVYGRAIAAAPENIDYLLGRGAAYAQAGDRGRAGQDFVAAHAAARDAQAVGRVCRQAVLAGFSVQSSAKPGCGAMPASLPEAVEGAIK